MNNKIKANRLVAYILEDLNDRAGVGDELNIMSDDVYKDMENNLEKIVCKKLDEWEIS